MQKKSKRKKYGYFAFKNHSLQKQENCREKFVVKSKVTQQNEHSFLIWRIFFSLKKKKQECLNTLISRIFFSLSKKKTGMFNYFDFTNFFCKQWFRWSEFFSLSLQKKKKTGMFNYFDFTIFFCKQWFRWSEFLALTYSTK